MADLPPNTPASTVVADTTQDGIPVHQSAAPVKPNQPTDIKPEPSKVIPEIDEKIVATPVKEGDEDTIDLTKFLEASGKVTTTPETKKDGEPESKIELPHSEKVKQDKATRDVSTVEDKDLAKFLMEDMSRKAYDKIKPIIDEYKKLKTDVTVKDTELTKTKTEYEEFKKKGPQLPESYSEHPEGYLLNPEFKQALGKAQISKVILDHWTKQLDDVSQGAKDFDMIDFDRNGNLVITGKIAADRLSEAKLMQYINHGQQLVNTSTSELQTIAKVHNEKYINKVKELNDFTNQAFSFFDTPQNKPIYEPLINKTAERFGAFRNNPLTNLLVKSLVLNETLASLLQKNQQRSGDDKPVVQQSRVNLNPTGDEIGGDGGGKGNGKSEISIDDFEKVKAGY